MIPLRIIVNSIQSKVIRNVLATRFTTRLLQCWVSQLTLEISLVPEILKFPSNVLLVFEILIPEAEIFKKALKYQLRGLLHMLYKNEGFLFGIRRTSQ